MLHAVRGQRARERSPSCSQLEREREESSRHLQKLRRRCRRPSARTSSWCVARVRSPSWGRSRGRCWKSDTATHTHSLTPTHTTRFSGLAELSFEPSEGHGRYPKRDYSTLSRVSVVRARSSHSLSSPLSLSVSVSAGHPSASSESVTTVKF